MPGATLGGRTDRPWTVPLAVGWAIPLAYPTMLATMICTLAYVKRAAAGHATFATSL